MDVGSGKRKRNRSIESEMDSASGVDRETEDHRDQRLREFQKQKSRERERERSEILGGRKRETETFSLSYINWLALSLSCLPTTQLLLKVILLGCNRGIITCVNFFILAVMVIEDSLQKAVIESLNSSRGLRSERKSEGRGLSDLFSQELILRSYMEMEMLGFKDLSQNFCTDSEELFKIWLKTGEASNRVVC
ncbi:hypothetical protein ACLB2K_045396 [Fragaria x ananassa]